MKIFLVLKDPLFVLCFQALFLRHYLTAQKDKYFVSLTDLLFQKVLKMHSSFFKFKHKLTFDSQLSSFQSSFGDMFTKQV